MLYYILIAVVALITGGLIAWFIQASRLGSVNGAIRQKAADLEDRLKDTSGQLDRERTDLMQKSTELASAKQDISHLQERLQEQKKEMEGLQEKFKTEFENIANRLLDEKSRKFTQQNQERLGEILKPLSERIREFEKKVEDTHKESLEKNAALKEQILGLKELNEQMSKDANNLTKALKGESKTQGNWGEVILERLLEKSGLKKGSEYRIQESITDTDGRRLQPDVIIDLPEDRHIIIDSKVSLTAYERFASEEDEDKRERFVRDHLNSIRTHVKQLSDKNYQQIYSLNSLDFVLLFVPIEPALNLAYMSDDDLFNFAFERNIVLVSSSTLLATLRTIASIWRQEYQNRNVRKIAEEAGNMYDKFVGFVEDMKKVGQQMTTARSTYEGAMNKLSEGRGNLVSRAEKLRKLGARGNKELDRDIVDRAIAGHSEEFDEEED